MKKSFGLILLSLILINSAIAQNANIISLEMDAGLSSNYVLSIAEDKHGRLWFATEEGLNVFDGLSFQSFYKNIGTAKGLTGNELNCIIDDKTRPILWIGTQREGLNAYNYETGHFTYYRHDDADKTSLSTNDITSISLDADGNLWITTFWKGLEHFNITTEQFTHYNIDNVKGLPEDRMWASIDIGHGQVLVGHASSGLSLIDTKNRQATNYRHSDTDPKSINSNSINCIYRDSRGHIWIGTDRGIDLFDLPSGRFTHFYDNGMLQRRIFDIREMADHQLWIGTELNGIAVINLDRINTAEGTATVRYIAPNNAKGLMNAWSVRCLHEDKFHNKWFGTYGEGVHFISEYRPLFTRLGFSSSDISTGLTDKAVMAVCQDHSGNLWVGTDLGGLNIFDSHGVRQRVMPLHSSVQALMCDSKGRMWIGMFVNGAYIWSNGTMKRIAGLPEREDVRAFYEWKDGFVYISSSNGIYKVDANKAAVEKHFFSGNLVRSITRDKKGLFYVATFGAGLFVLDASGDKTLVHQNTKSGFPSNTVNQVIIGHDATIWAATGEGLVRMGTDLSHGDYKTFGYGNGLNNIHIRSIAEDRKGNLWVGTNKGISCMKKGSQLFLNYNYKDNVPQGNFYAGSVAQGADGLLFFGSNNGMCFFDPTEVLIEREAPPVRINKLTINTAVAEDDSIIDLSTVKSLRLDYSQNTLTVTFSVENYAIAGAVEYAYNLHGLSSEWIIANENSITFRELPPGRYQLQVKSRFRNQPWCKEIATVDITIRPPLWLSWWAKLLYVIIALVAVWLLLRNYKHRLHLEYLLRSEKKVREQENKLNDERLNFFTNITHELRTPLTLIIGPLDDMERDATLDATTKRRVTAMNDSAKRLYSLISNILEFRKTETSTRRLCVGRGNVVAIVREDCAKFQELNRNTQVEVVFTADEEIVNIYFDKEIVDTIVSNFVSNALKYTPQGSVTVHTQRRQIDATNYFEISVTDTGYGIDQKAIPHIFDRYYQAGGEHQASGTGIGLALVKSLAELHQGEVGVESQLGKGSTFWFRVREDNTYNDSPHTEGRSTEKIATAPIVEPQPKADVRSRSIMLIVEDNADIGQYIADAFSGRFQIVTAVNGRDGLDKAFEHLPDIIISDVMMPQMDGNEMCHRLKTDIRTSHIPIILLTAKDSMTAREEGYQAGADSYITKPFVSSLLASRVDNLLQQRRMLIQTYKTGHSDSSVIDKQQQLRQAMSQLDRHFLDRIDEQIEANLKNETFDLNLLSRQLNMSLSSLYRKMTALTGLSANEYIRKYRMRKAEQLLLEGNHTITEIGYEVGINTTAYFRKLFKEEFGVTPSDYLKRLNNP